MRTIKFRGKSCSNGDWFYGNLYDYDKDGRTHICGLERGCLNIDPNTVGQFTGLLDKKGKEIYEGDIVELREPNGMPNICKVEMCEKGYWCVSFGIHERIILGFIDKNQITVIGNIHDNPELIKIGEE